MRIGIDFDNTIACYDGVFHAAAVERGLIPPSGVGSDKTSVRDYLRGQGRDADFTELQGYVYGPGMKHVDLYPGLGQALRRLRGGGHALFIVSHKTKAPFAGPPHDLHACARTFLADRGLLGDAFGEDEVFFELTKEAKVERVGALACDAFVDDLPEIFDLGGFAPRLRKILFDPEGRHEGPYEAYREWPALARALLGG